MVLVAEIRDTEENTEERPLTKVKASLIFKKLGLWPWVPNEIKQQWEEKILCFLELFSLYEKQRDEFPTDDIKLLLRDLPANQ
ncbi:MAG: hypothetical protein CM15mP130_1200 [Verrucomicrobiota bacterium]|nr:MAG: hypothetical protein CM15mP130_1200 [Verrucomicrobiota bacterium]